MSKFVHKKRRGGRKWRFEGDSSLPEGTRDISARSGKGEGVKHEKKGSRPGPWSGVCAAPKGAMRAP